MSASHYPAGLRYSGGAIARADGETTLSMRMGDASKLPIGALRYAVVWRKTCQPTRGGQTAENIRVGLNFGRMSDGQVEAAADRYQAEMGGEAGMRAWLQAQMDAEKAERELAYQKANARAVAEYHRRRALREALAKAQAAAGELDLVGAQRAARGVEHAERAGDGGGRCVIAGEPDDKPRLEDKLERGQGTHGALELGSVGTEPTRGQGAGIVAGGEVTR